MTVRELIELNPNITDLEIIVRNYPDNGMLLDALHIGPDSGVKPPYPLMVGPGTKRQKETKYIRKNINAYDDGRDYWEIKPERIPEAYLNLQVHSWCHRTVYHGHHLRDDFTGSMEKYEITTYKPDADLTVKDEKPKAKKEQLEGQMFITDFI